MTARVTSSSRTVRCCGLACRRRHGSRSTTLARATPGRTASAHRSVTTLRLVRHAGRKSRLNFLDLLRAGHTDYVINDAALAYMRERALAGPVIACLATHPDRHFADARLEAHLPQLGITDLTVTPDPVRIATEGALFGSFMAHGFLRQTVIVSDDAGQFDVGRHALCWVHAERLVHKLDTFTDPPATPRSGCAP